MKLRAVRLENVRRFSEPVEITGLRDGLNVLAAPNESGKSTLFDALNAAFFYKANDWAVKRAQGLQPHAGGHPSVTVTLETEEGVFTIERVWAKSAGPRVVRVRREGQVIAQADAAEAWIADLVTPTAGAGPAGLLWVRQGFVQLDKDTETARRDLLGSVTGEVDAMTGGRQMEALRRQLDTDLADYVTSRGARKGGPLERAETQVDALRTARDGLQAKARSLRDDLAARQRLLAEKTRLEAPGEWAVRQEALAHAEAALAAGRAHADKLAAAATALEVARLALEATEGKLARLEAAQAAVATAKADLDTAEPKAEAAKVAATQADEALRAAIAQMADSRAALAQCRQALDRVLAAERAQEAGARRDALDEKIARGQAQAEDLARLAAAAQAGPDAEALAWLQELDAAVTLADQMRRAAAPQIAVRYAEDAVGRVNLAGDAMADGRLTPVLEEMVLHLDGIGTLTIRPGAQEGGAHDPAAARAKRAEALRNAGYDDLAAAQAAARQAAEAASERRALEKAYRAEFPGGLDPLFQARAELPDPDTVPSGAELPNRAKAQAAADEAETAHKAAETALAKAQEVAARARETQIKAAMVEKAAQDRMAQAQAALDEAGDPANLQTVQAREAAALGQAAAHHRALADAAPDLDALTARAERLRAADDGIRGRLQEVETDLARLDGRIRSEADAGVDQDQAEPGGRLEAAEAELAALHTEVGVLRRLAAALEAARAAAQDAYVAPVTREFRPLLAQVLPGAEVNLDPEAVLPGRLRRANLDEAFDTLSGGTREQIALLVRLAFARMLARAGRPAPVILDDAIVFTDDDRIERLFDTLTREARDLQILVLSCRQQAFRNLGGTQLTLRPVGEG